MRRRLVMLAVTACAWGCAGGGSEKKGGDAQGAAAAPGGEVRAGEVLEEGAEEKRTMKVEAALGEIAYVDEEGGFVLVRASPSARVTPGEAIEARTASGVASGELRLSHERKRHFLVADITGGRPALGHQVYYQVEIPLPSLQNASQPDDFRGRGTRAHSRKSSLQRR